MRQIHFPDLMDESRLRKVNSFPRNHPIGSERLQVLSDFSKAMCLLGWDLQSYDLLMSMGRHAQADLQFCVTFSLLSFLEPWEPPNSAAPGYTYVNGCVCTGVALFAGVCLLTTSKCLGGYICGKHAQGPGGCTEPVAVHKGWGVFEGGTSWPVLYLPVAVGFPLCFLMEWKMKGVCTCYNDIYTWCCLNVLRKERPHPEREHSSLDQGQHTFQLLHPQCLDCRGQARERACSVRRVQERSWWRARVASGAQVARKNDLILQSSTLWGG